MQFKTLFAIAAFLTAATALPNDGGTTTTTTAPGWTTTTTKTTTTKTPTSTKKVASPTPTTNNGQQFVNKCVNTGVSIGDCTQLANIAALNGANVNVGGSPSKAPSGSVNNGQQFLNQCKNSGISVLDCSQLLNLAILNGLAIDISVGDLAALLKALGLPAGIASLLGSSGTIISIPAGIV